MRKKLNDTELVKFQDYLFENVGKLVLVSDLSDSDFDYHYNYFLNYYKSTDEGADYVISLSKSVETTNYDNVEKTLDDYLKELDIYVDLNNLSPEAIKKILVASESKFREADEAFDKSSELLDETLKNLEASKNHLSKVEEFNNKSKYINPHGFGKLIHKMYDDSKSLLSFGIVFIVIYGVFSGPFDEYKEENKVLKFAITETEFFDKDVQDSYLENEVKIDLKKLDNFYTDISYILENGYDKEDDIDVIKSIYIKSIIINENLESYDITDKDFKKKLSNLIVKLESDLDINE